MTIEPEAFFAVDIRVGRIVTAEANAGARKPAYRLTIDFGPELGIKTSSAGITDRYEAEDLVGRHVMAVVNLPPRQVASVMSEVLVLGFDAGDGIVLAVPDGDVPLGARLH